MLVHHSHNSELVRVLRESMPGDSARRERRRSYAMPKRKSKRTARQSRSFGQTAAGDTTRKELVEWIKRFSDGRAREFAEERFKLPKKVERDPLTMARAGQR